MFRSSAALGRLKWGSPMGPVPGRSIRSRSMWKKIMDIHRHIGLPLMGPPITSQPTLRAHRNPTVFSIQIPSPGSLGHGQKLPLLPFQYPVRQTIRVLKTRFMRSMWWSIMMLQVRVPLRRHRAQANRPHRQAQAHQAHGQVARALRPQAQANRAQVLRLRRALARLLRAVRLRRARAGRAQAQVLQVRVLHVHRVRVRVRQVHPRAGQARAQVHRLPRAGHPRVQVQAQVRLQANRVQAHHQAHPRANQALRQARVLRQAGRVRQVHRRHPRANRVRRVRLLQVQVLQANRVHPLRVHRAHRVVPCLRVRAHLARLRHPLRFRALLRAVLRAQANQARARQVHHRRVVHRQAVHPRPNRVLRHRAQVLRANLQAQVLRVQAVRHHQNRAQALRVRARFQVLQVRQAVLRAKAQARAHQVRAVQALHPRVQARAVQARPEVRRALQALHRAQAPNRADGMLSPNRNPGQSSVIYRRPAAHGTNVLRIIHKCHLQTFSQPAMGLPQDKALRSIMGRMGIRHMPQAWRTRHTTTIPMWTIDTPRSLAALGQSSSMLKTAPEVER